MKTVKLFSYGTLQNETVQRSLFGRKLQGEKTLLYGYQLQKIVVTEGMMPSISGLQEYPIIIRSENENDVISGTVYTITTEKLITADQYEDLYYQRIEVELKCGQKAWVYVSATDPVSTSLQ